MKKIYEKNKNFHPTQAPVSWNKAVKYIKAKDVRLTFNARFRPLFAALKKEMREEGCHESIVKERAKEKAKAILKAEDQALFAPEPNSPESQALLPVAD